MSRSNYADDFDCNQWRTIMRMHLWVMNHIVA